jgi:hypothetical protein
MSWNNKEDSGPSLNLLLLYTDMKLGFLPEGKAINLDWEMILCYLKIMSVSKFVRRPATECL